MNTPKGFVDDSIIALLKEEELLVKMGECKTPEECYELVKDKVAVDFEEFKAMMLIAKSNMAEKEDGLLSDDDLEAVAGGKMTDDQIIEVTGVVVSVAGVIASAAAA